MFYVKFFLFLKVRLILEQRVYHNLFKLQKIAKRSRKLRQILSKLLNKIILTLIFKKYLIFIKIFLPKISSQNNIKPQGFQDLFSIIPDSINPTDLTFSFCQNNINSAEVQKLIQALSQISNLQNLYLNLSKNNIIDSNILDLFSDISKFPSLQQLNLNLSYNKINELHAHNLFSNLLKCPKLSSVQLNLRENQLKEIITIQFQSNLSCFSNLQKLVLYLNRNLIDLQNAINLFESLSHLNNLSYLNLDLNLSDNCFESKIEQEISNYLSRLKNLKVLHLYIQDWQFYYDQQQREQIKLRHQKIRCALIKKQKRLIMLNKSA
ncbi:hypothetical protein TTHERM_000559751 (macronuclear) [Tetrahymena thermophila SB210]|uniref:Uncharacterized protein n=1 Tax=Tetrahymena thermophila (strain SB210) TaxID=312017 RepID=W7XG42_TETTS|nr:hypothetical protein TTHERM_000559751 [Tetrahymena thermophila SB210]EWS75873.1 hypothetical protein TTHERM_000559751 [Tetrahymena thermophila SB210]|eukprot:XP_012651576.1 hypothetical protein TTHERM_000559751 [Tetrahymena thermophila SB210]